MMEGGCSAEDAPLHMNLPTVAAQFVGAAVIFITVGPLRWKWLKLGVH